MSIIAVLHCVGRYLESLCRLLEAVCIVVARIHPTEALWLCAAQAWLLTLANLLLRPCVVPWDHMLMAGIMAQEGLWYALVALYGADAPSAVVSE